MGKLDTVLRLPALHPKGVCVLAIGLLGLSPLSRAQSVYTYPYTFSTISGTAGVAGSADGAAPAALFDSPMKPALDGQGNLYVADYANHVIRKLSPTLSGGTVTWVASTIAGSAGVSGSADGAGSSARFNNPSGVAIDGSGRLFVADYANVTVREIVPSSSGTTTTWTVTTLAGAPEQSGASDGIGAMARFSGPVGIAVDGNGNLFVTDSPYCTIREISPSSSGGVTTWTVKTIAGTPNYLFGTNPGGGDGVGAGAQFFDPGDVVVDANDTLYVADSGNDEIRMITPSVSGGSTIWTVRTIAGSGGPFGSPGSSDGPNVEFNWPSALALDGNGNLFVADSRNGTVRRLAPPAGGTGAWTATTVAGVPGVHSNVDGTGSAVEFVSPLGLAVDSRGGLFVTDASAETVRLGYPSRAIPVASNGTETLQYGQPLTFELPASNPEGDTLSFSILSSTGGTVSVTGGQATFTPTSLGSGSITYSAAYDYAVSNTGEITLTINQGAATVTLGGLDQLFDGTTKSVSVTTNPAGLATRVTYNGDTSAPSAVGSYSVLATVTDSDYSGSASATLTISSPAPSPTPTQGVTPTPTVTAAPSVTPSPIAMPTPEITPTPAATPTPTASPAPSPTPTPGVTPTPVTTPTPGATPSPVATPSPEITPTPAATPTPTAPPAPTPTPNPTATPTPDGNSANSPPSFATQPSDETADVGAAATFWVIATGNPTPSYQWSFDGTPIGGATDPILSINPVFPSSAGTYTVTIANSLGSISSNPAKLSLNSAAGVSAPTIVQQPSSQVIASGSTVAFNVGVSGATISGSSLKSVMAVHPQSGDGAAVDAPTQSFQWICNGVPLANATDPTLVIANVSPSNNGNYACLATNAAGSVMTSEAALSVISTSDPGRLINISCRALVEPGANQLIMGFVVGGLGTSGSRSFLIRASGPALAAFGVTGAVPDPQVTLNNSSGFLATDFRWSGNKEIADAATLVGAFPWTNISSDDSALVESLPLGAYTAEISGAGNDSGIALAEVYDASPSYTPSQPRLVNISARVHVGNGSNALIAGFVIGGTTAKTVLVRASGPALIPFGIPGTLPDPRLQLYSTASGSTLLATNAGWSADPQITSAAASVGAFSWGGTSTPDSAILMTLPPGPYTANVSGASGDTGIALVEVYELP